MLLRPSSIFQIAKPELPPFPPTGLLSWWFAGNGYEKEPTITGSNGNPVTAWGDKSGIGYNLTKTGGGIATYNQRDVSFNNRGTVSFDGSVYMLATVLSGILAQNTVFNQFLVISTTVAVQSYMYSEGNNSSLNPIVGTRNINALGNGGNVFRGDTTVPEAQANGGDINNGNTLLITIRRIDPTNFRIRVNGVQVGSDLKAVTVPTITRIAIGCLIRTTPQAFFIGKIATIANYSVDNYQLLESEIMKYYGII